MKFFTALTLIILSFLMNNNLFSQSLWNVYTTSNSGICNNKVTSIYKDSNETFWFGTSMGVSKFDGSSWTSFTPGNSEYQNLGDVRAITELNGDYYFACAHGFNFYRSTYWDYIAAGAFDITSMDIDDAGNLWFGTANTGLQKYDWSGNIPRGYTSSNSPLPSNRIEDIEIDKDGNIWIAMIPENFPVSYEPAGIAKFDGTSWQVFNSHNSILTCDNVRSIVEDNEGNLWFGADSLLLYKFDGANWERYDLSEGPTSNWLSSLAVGQDGSIWAGLGYYSSERGVIQFDGSNITRYGTDEGFPSEEVYDLEVDKFNNVWIGTQAGLLKLNNGVKTNLSGIDSLRSLTNINLQWTHNFQNNIKLEYTTNNGSTWLLIADNVDIQNEIYSWTVPVVAPPSDLCKIRISDVINPGNFIESDSCFTIYAKVEAPVITPGGGIQNNGINVSISCSTDSADIYYTINGGEPDQDSIKYVSPFYINKNSTIKAKVFKSNWVDSDLKTTVYQMKVGNISFNPSAGTYNTPQQVILNTVTDSAVIYYTLDGTEPSKYSQVYSQSININESRVIKAFAYRNDFESSPIAEGNFIISPPNVIPKIKTDNVWMDSDFDGYEERVVDGSESSTTYGTINFYQWTVNCGLPISGPKPHLTLQTGTNKISLKVATTTGDTAETYVNINVCAAKLETGGAINSAPAQLDNNTFFITSTDDKIYQFDSTAAVRWNILTGGSIQSTTCINDQNNIYVGSSDTRLYCFDKEGSPKWDKAMGGIITSSPSAGKDGAVYVGINTGRLYALDGTGNIKWHVQTGGAIISSPAVSVNGNIYVGSCDKKLYSVNENGEVNWTFTTGDTILSSPAIGDDSCIVFGSNDGYLYKLSPDGSKKWSYFAGGKIKSSPIIINNGLLLFGNSNNEIVSLDKDGEVTWKYITDAPVSGTAVISRGGQILFGDEDGVLYNLDPLGNLHWYFRTDSPIESPILLTENHLAIFGNLNGDVFILKLDPRQSMYTDSIRYEWPTFKGNNKRTGNKTDVLLSLKDNGITAIKEYCLFQNYPNPFNPSTTIKYQIPRYSFVSLKVFDAIGREVANLVNGQQNAGDYEIHFNANYLSSGIYFYRIQAGEFSETKKLILLK